jgi:hypothetical protein
LLRILNGLTNAFHKSYLNFFNFTRSLALINHFHYACRDHGSGLAAAAVFGTNTPLFGTIDAFGGAEVVTGIRGASAC